jgi:hypothetical protein
MANDKEADDEPSKPELEARARRVLTKVKVLAFVAFVLVVSVVFVSGRAAYRSFGALGVAAVVGLTAVGLLFVMRRLEEY